MMRVADACWHILPVYRKFEILKMRDGGRPPSWKKQKFPSTHSLTGLSDSLAIGWNMQYVLYFGTVWSSLMSVPLLSLLLELLWTNNGGIPGEWLPRPLPVWSTKTYWLLGDGNAS